MLVNNLEDISDTLDHLLSPVRGRKLPLCSVNGESGNLLAGEWQGGFPKHGLEPAFKVSDVNW